jgi:FAD/FMN-containing dehydrogenase
MLMDPSMRALNVGLRIAGAAVTAFNFHYNVLQPAEGDAVEFKRRMHEVSRRIHDIAIRLGGSISAEHGLGQLKGSDVFGYKDPLQLRLMRAIKAAIDPFDLMNKGKIFPE